MRVSTLELFFDLVFVFTATQLTAVLSDRFDAEALLQVVLMLGLIWWMYGGYAWLTNALAPDTAARRLLLLGGMGAYLTAAHTRAPRRPVLVHSGYCGCHAVRCFCPTLGQSGRPRTGPHDRRVARRCGGGERSRRPRRASIPGVRLAG